MALFLTEIGKRGVPVTAFVEAMRQLHARRSARRGRRRRVSGFIEGSEARRNLGF